MRRLTSLLGVVLLAAGCAGGATTTPMPPTNPPAATPAATPAPTAAPTPAPTETWGAASARLTFDGSTCTYTGPTVVTEPAFLSLEFAPAKETYAVNFGTILSGTKMEQVKLADAPEYGPAPGHKVPEWLLTSTWSAAMGSMTAKYPMAIVKLGDKVYDQVLINCVRNPWTSDKPADTIEGRMAGAIIKLVPAAS